MSLIAPIATNLVMSKFGGKSQLPQQSALKAPPDVNIYEKSSKNN